jgi:hypothetical protein
VVGMPFELRCRYTWLRAPLANGRKLVRMRSCAVEGGQQRRRGDGAH